MALLGRDKECDALNRLLEAIHGGESRVLVVRGDAGMGKSALLEHVRERAAGCRVAAAAGVQSEMELAFAGLHQLAAPLLDRLPGLPEPQRDALGTAFGLAEGAPPDRFFVGLAMLSLLSDVAGEQPLVCLVDDAQWLDRGSAQALGFVARRLAAESIALVLAVRDHEAAAEWAGLPELMLEGLQAWDARELLASVIRGPLDAMVRDRIVSETGGNPLALLELPRDMGPEELAGGFGLADPRTLPGRIEESYLRRLELLPADTRRLMLVAAADALGEPLLLWRAAWQLGTGPAAARAAQDAGLLEVGASVRFRHPLVRSAVYRSASEDERRRAHAALAEACDPEADPDRRAWHRAQAVSGPDEDVAAELERSAGRAQARGGLAAAAAFLQRAAVLSVDPALQARRALDAAQAKHQAGASDAAMELLATAEAGPLDELNRARAGWLRGQVAFASSHGRDAAPLLLVAAKRFEPLDPALARETYLDAFAAALFAGRLASGGDLRDVAAAARATPPAVPPARLPDRLLDGLVSLVSDGYAAATPALQQVLRSVRTEPLSIADALRWLWTACHVAHDLWDDESWDVLSARHAAAARDSGALSILPIALHARVGLHLIAGASAAAAELVEEIETITAATGSELPRYAALAVAAWQGREADARELIDSCTAQAAHRGEGIGLTLVEWETAVLYNGLGRYDDALAPAQRASEHWRELGFATLVLGEVVEAAAQSGATELAAGALEKLVEATRFSGSEWGLGIQARSRALLSEGESAERLYREAIERLGRSRARAELARAHLLCGEWLRRERRRLEAREQLRTAHELLSTMGMTAFAARAERELRATGETARKHTVETVGGLTPQEAQIARFARDGLSNSEIGARLFISPRTVEYHLHKVFAKLNITSRVQLAQTLPHEPAAARSG